MIRRREPHVPSASPRFAPIAGFLLTLSVLMAAASPVRAQYFGQNKVQYETRNWSVATTEHFQVHFHEGEREAALDVCRMAERAYSRLSEILKHEVEEPIPLILYASHAEFQQTNVSEGLIDEGTGGFTEYYKGRVTLPLTGSYRDLDHVLTHELVHAFQVDILFGGKRGVSNPFQYAPPLWFMEGMAEYLSLLEVDPQTAMWLRDGALEGYLTPLSVLERVGDIRVYRYGQSVLSYLGKTFGDQAIGDVLKKTAATRSLPKAFEETIGLTLEKFSENWIDDVRKTYLPEIRDHEKPSEFAFPLTHAEKELSSFYLGPALSPDGDRMTYFSNPSLYNDLFLASAVNGEVEKRLVKGERKADFESLRFYTSSTDWSPDGTRIVFVALVNGRDAIYVQNVDSGRIERKIRVRLDGVTGPSFSPDGQWIVFSGLKGGRSNLYRVRTDGSDFEALTEGRYLVQEPRFAPDGNRIVFVTDRGPETDFDNLLFSLPRFAIFDLRTREVTLPPGQTGRNVSAQFFPDGRHLLFASDRSGIPNLFIRDLETNEDRRVTDVLSGVMGLIPNGSAVSLSRNGKRAVFSAYRAGTWNLFALKDPLSLWDKSEPWVEPSAEVAPAIEGGASPRDSDASAADSTAIVLAIPPSRTGDSGRVTAPPPADTDSPSEARLDSLWSSVEDLSVVAGEPRVDAAADSTEPEPIRAAEIFAEKRALPDDSTIEVDRYRPRFSADYVAANGFFQSSVGLAAQSVLRFSDLLGDQVILVGVDVYGSLKDSNLLFEYVNLKRRTTWGLSVFQFNNDYFIFSTDTEDEFVSRTNRGLNLTLQRPWNRFRRLEWSMEALAVTEETLRERVAGSGYYYPSGDETTYFYVLPGVAVVHDNTLYGITGPISGGRSRLSAEMAAGDLSFRTYVGDLRRYYNIRHSYAVALRGVGALSEGHDPQFFRVGGPYTLRGYEFGEFRGSRLLLANAEFRFPLIDELRLGWPLPLALAGVRGALFFDAGTALEPGDSFQPFASHRGLFKTEDLKASYGVSASLNLGFTVLKWDLAWRTNLARTASKPRGFLSFGLEY